MYFLATLSATPASILDDGVLSFVVDGAKDVIGLMVEGPLGLFISISIVSLIVSVAIRIMRSVRR